jgi:hypothetical protein
VFGSKSSDNISVAPDVTVETTLDGGHGGDNAIHAGGAAAVEHGWFGKNTLTGSPLDDSLIGAFGHVRFVKTAGHDTLFAGRPKHQATLHSPGIAPGGTFYKFVGNRLIPVQTPKAAGNRITALSAGSTPLGNQVVTTHHVQRPILQVRHTHPLRPAQTAPKKHV